MINIDGPTLMGFAALLSSAATLLKVVWEHRHRQRDCKACPPQK